MLRNPGTYPFELTEAYQTVCSRAVAGWISQARMKRMSHLGCKNNSLMSATTPLLPKSSSLRGCNCQGFVSYGSDTGLGLRVGG